MRELGLSEQYERELAKIIKAQKLPAPWASPDQRCRAAVKTMKSRTA
jgi:hypothetical protein